MKDFRIVYHDEDLGYELDPFNGVILSGADISAIEKEFSLFKKHKGETFEFGIEVSMTYDIDFLSLYKPFIYEDWEVKPFCKYQAFKPLHKKDEERLKKFLRNFEYYNEYDQEAITLIDENGVFFLFGEEW